MTVSDDSLRGGELQAEIIQQAIQAIQSGDRERGRLLLTQLLSSNPKEARAWLWLAACWDDPEKKRFCLEKALALRPDDPQIRAALQLLSAASAAPESAPAEALPGPSEKSGLAPGTSAPKEEPAEGVRLEPGREVEIATRKETGSSAKAKPSQRTTAGGLLRTILLLLLSALALASIAILGFVILSTESPLMSVAPPPAQPQSPQGEVPVFQLPATWTLTPSSAPPATEFRPTFTPVSTLTSVPSITPFFAQWRIVIGNSVRNRPIEVFRFGTGEHERLIIAGIHGGQDENAIALADQLIEHLQENSSVVPTDATLYILRSLNPDGQALGSETAGYFNANGVDLDRNFGANWKSSWEGQGCISSDPETAGSQAASEPESQAFIRFLSARQVEALISYQGAGSGIYPASLPASSESVRLAQAIAEISDHAYPPPEPGAEAGCEYTGRLVDAALALGVQAAVDLKLDGSTGPNLAASLEILTALLSWQPLGAPSPTVTTTPTISATVTLSATATLPTAAAVTISPLASPGFTTTSPPSTP